MFKNDQWEVTEYGLEAIVGSVVPNSEGITTSYEIEAKRLSEITSRGEIIFYDWPVHMAEKTWVNIDMFIEAFQEALKFHRRKYKAQIDSDMLKRSFNEAQKIASEKFD